MKSLSDWNDKPVKYLRDKVIDQLKYNYAQNNLEAEEFERLVSIALSTQSKSELVSLVADLPKSNGSESKLQAKGLMPTKDKGSIICVFSGINRKGVWIPPKQLKIITVFGGAEIDFRQAQFGEITYVTIGCCFGGVEIIVPPGFNVVSNATAIFGGIDNPSDTPTDPNSPTIVIEGLVIFGGVSVKVSPLSGSPKRIK